MLTRIAIYFKMNPARISAYISALVLYFNKHFPSLPIDIVIPSVLVIIGFGEYSQRMEDRKTIDALYADNEPNVADEAIIKKLCYNSYRENKRGGK
jgi:hypothetical protein